MTRKAWSIVWLIIASFWITTVDTLKPKTDVTVEESLGKWLALESKLKGGLDSLVHKILPLVIGSDNDIEMSLECSEDILKWVLGLKEMKSWALKMLDATGKPPGGMAEGVFWFGGNFHECIELEFPMDAEDETATMGQYCSVSIATKLPPQPTISNLKHDIFDGLNYTFETELFEHIRKYGSAMYSGSLVIGVCLPSTCSKNDINQIISATTQFISPVVTIRDCATADIEVTTIQKSVLIIFGIIMLINVLALFIDNHINTGNKKPTSIFRSVVAAFSPLTNLRKTMIVKERSSDDIFSCLNGARFISMIWVILNHSYLSVSPGFWNTLRGSLELSRQFFIQIVINGYLNVDTFFTITGILLGYNVVKLCDSKGFKGSFIVILIVRRIWRFLPIGLLTMGVFIILPLFTSGPNWTGIVGTQAENCVARWWTVPLFLTNYDSLENSCMAHYWYLSVDVQMFLIVGVVYFILLYKIPILAFLYLGLAMLLSILVPAIIIYVKNYPPIITADFADVKVVLDYTLFIYESAYNHCGTYAIGLLLGTFMARKEKVELSKIQLTVGWFLSCSTALTVIYVIYIWYDASMVYPLEAVLYGSLHKNAWSLSLCWVFFVCAIGKGGLVNDFLSWKGFQPLVRISLVLYLLQNPAFTIYGASLTTTIYAHHSTFIWIFFGNVAVTTLAALLVRVFFDGPMCELDKIFFGWLTSGSGKPRHSDGSKVKMTETYKKTAEDEKPYGILR